ncbi:MAG: ABC transporter permease, partial [Vicinamibacteria bacterium]
LAAIAILGLGIGACTAMFSVVNAVLLRPLPVTEPDRLVWIENTITAAGLSGRTSRADVVLGWREQTKAFSSIAAYFAFSDYGRLTLTGAGEPERLRSMGVSDNFLPTLGVIPLLGRNFSVEESKFNGPGAVILSYDFWQRRFAGDPTLVGRTLTLSNKPTAVVGVLPRSFDFDSIFTPGNGVDLLEVFPLAPETARQGNTVFGIGRLNPGVSIKDAQADLTVINARLHETVLKNNTFGAKVTSLNSSVRGRFRGAFLLLAGAVICVLGIACMNLSNLLLARINVRRQEFAVRVSLGARRGHLIRQALTESLLLAFAGSAVGLPLAIWATRVITGSQTFGVAMLQDASVDPLAVAVTVGLTTLAGMACGILPALYLSSGGQSQTLQNATHQRTAGRSTGAARTILIVSEVALACVLLVSAGLLFRSVDSVLKVDVGFEPQNAMSWRLERKGFKSGAEVQTYMGELSRRIAALPGVEEVGFSDTLPLGRNRSWGAGAEGVQYRPGEYPEAFPRLVSPRYLRAMKIPLVAGRQFDDEFDPAAPKRVIINETLARRLWPGQDPLARKIENIGEVIGVAANVRHESLEQAGANEMYLDFRQNGSWSAIEMVVRSARRPESLIPDVRAALKAFDPTMPNGEYYQLERLIDNAVAPRQLVTRLLGFFSTLALSLAALGLYSVMAYSVAQRRQEIGIRMAIGAQRRDVLKMVVRGGLGLVIAGIVIGLAGSLALTSALQSQLFGVSAHDPMTFAAIASILFGVALLACVLPALRATRVDPMIALRVE